VKGKVRVRVLGRASVALTGPVLVPIGSEIDTTAGRVRLTFATALADGGPPTQSGEFYDGAFTIFQSTKATLVELGLSGAASGCGKTASSSATTNRKRKRKVLWGDAHGQFRSTGANAAATVRGTRWLTENNCDGTRVQVARGVVSVRDLVRNTTTEVRAGHSYTARNPCASRRRFDIRVRVPPGVLVRDVRVSVRGKKVKVRRGKRIVATIDLRNAPRGRFTVHITLVTTSGAEIDGSRVYRTCSQELDPGAPPTI
jgi:hypothetical protein